MEVNKPVSTLIVAIVSLLLVFLFVLPKYQEARALEALLSQKQAEYNGKAVYYTRMSELLAGLESRKNILEKINSSLPAEFSLADLTYFFQKNAKDNSLTITSLEFSRDLPVAYRKTATGSAKELKNMMLTVNFSGSYQGFKNLLYALDMSSRLFEVNTVSFAPTQVLPAKGQSKNALPVYDFKMEVITHAY